MFFLQFNTLYSGERKILLKNFERLKKVATQWREDDLFFKLSIRSLLMFL